MTLANRALSLTSKSPLFWFALSTLPIAFLFATALSLSPGSFRSSKNTIRLYCASAAVKPLKQITGQFNDSNIAKEKNVEIEIVRAGGTGELAGQILAEQASSIELGCDIFVSADSQRTQFIIENGIASESLAIASQHPVIAVTNYRSPSIADFSSLQTLLKSSDIRFAIGSKSTAIGSITRRIAKNQGLLKMLESSKTTDCENVMMLAQALTTGSVDAAIIWDSTVAQVRSANASQIQIAGYLDPDKNSRGMIEVTRINSSNSEADIFISYLRKNFHSVQEIMSLADFSSPVSKSLELVD